jgi:hypothetical protein
MTKYLLMGGLGNQLFQLAAALNYTEAGSDVVLVDKIGNPRTNEMGSAEISSFKLPPNVQLQEIKLKSIFLKKAINLGIRLSARKQRTAILKFSYRFFSQLLAAILRSGSNYVCISNGVGYDSNFKASQKGINIGYFQSHIYLNNYNTFHSMQGLMINNPSVEFQQMVARAKVDPPLVVHVRLGDYKTENSFGIPSAKYYSEALEYFETSDPALRIWLFSNEPREAITLIPEKFRERTEIVSVESLSSAETLELMRYGSSYIIANSSFSWWGAALSFTTNAKVIAPKPWFRSSRTPSELVPSTWLQFDAHYDLQNSEKRP